MKYIKGFYYDSCFKISEMYRHILYANAVFDIDNVFLGQVAQECNLCAVSVVTPTQIVNVPFDAWGYRRFGTGLSAHEAVTDRVLDRIYPDYSEAMRGKRKGSDVYYENLRNNIFILISVSAKSVTIVIDDDEKQEITQTQYDKLREYLEALRDSEAVKSGKIEDVWWGSERIDPEQITKRLEVLRNNVVERNDLPQEYPIGEFDFSSCQNDDEIWDLTEEYAKKLIGMLFTKNTTRVKATNSPNVDRGPLDTGR